MKRLLNAFHDLSIKRKMFFSFSVLVILPIIISSLFSSKIISNILIERISNANLDSDYIIAKNIDHLLDNVAYTLLNISRNDRLREILIEDREITSHKNTEGSSPVLYNQNKEIDNIFENAPLSVLTFSARLSVLCDGGYDFGNWEDYRTYAGVMKQSEWYKGIIESLAERITWLGVKKNIKLTDGSGEFFVEAAIPVKERKGSLTSIGLIHIGIPERVFSYMLNNLDTQREIYLINKKGEIISAKNENEVGTALIDKIDINEVNKQDKGWYIESGVKGQKIVVNYSTINKTGWKVISIVSYDKMLVPLEKTKKFLLTFNFIFMLSFLAVAMLISKSISKPIILMNKKMKSVEQGDFSQKMDVLYNDEIGNLSNNYNHMLDKVSQLIKLTKEQEKLKREAEFDALQAQINPHFLFNNLSSIRYEAVASNNKKIEDMVYSLSVMLRYSINSGPDLITLGQEIEMLKHYIALCQMRQGHIYTFECNIDDEVQEIKIPRLLLQPIVENSIIHGFEEKDMDGCIKVSGKISAELLELKIEDNGKGIDEEQLKNIKEGKLNIKNSNKLYKSIGIKNVNERIKLNYGTEYGISIKSKTGIGTVVTLILPYKKEESK